MSMNSQLIEFDQKDAEKGSPLDRPPVSFIPDKSLLDLESKATVILRSDVKDSDSTYKRSVPIVEIMTVEDAFYWEDEIMRIIKYKPCKEAESRFDMAEIFLSGAALETWKGIKTDICDTDKLAADGTRLVKPGRTKATFAVVLRAFIQSHFPSTTKHPARVQKDYIRFNLRAPYGLPMKQVGHRLVALSNYCARMPGNANKALDEDELCAILVRMVKPNWREQLQTSNAIRRDELTLQQHIEFFEQLEVNEAVVRGNKKNKNQPPSEKDVEKNKSSKKGNRHNSRKRGGQSTKDPPNKGPATTNKSNYTGNKLCKLCELYGGAKNTHNTDDCRRHKVKTEHKKWNGASKNEKGSQYAIDELYMQNMKLRKKLKKQKKRSRYDSESDSDSDSD